MKQPNLLITIGLLLTLGPFQTANAQRQVFSDFNDGSPDWDSSPDIGSAGEANGQLTIRAQFPATMGGLSKSLTSVGWARQLPIRDGQTLEYRVDLVRTSRDDVLAGIEYVAPATSGGGVYAFVKDRNQVFLLKVNPQAPPSSFFFHEMTSIKHQDVILSLALTGVGDSVRITARVLDKTGGGAVLFERTVVDTPGIDPTVAELSHQRLQPDPGPPYRNGTHQFLYLGQYTDGNQPEVEAVYDNFTYEYRAADPFTKITSGQIATDKGRFLTGAWGDYDNDGFIDLFVANYIGSGPAPSILPMGRTNVLYRNLGGGTFARITEGSVVQSSNSTGGIWGDADNDGDLDLFVSNKNPLKNLLYRNDGNGAFSQATEGPFAIDPGTGSGVAWGDYDNDGALDLFASAGFNQRPYLYRNNGDGTFLSILPNPIPSGADKCTWADYDNDGDLDLFIVGFLNNQNEFLYQNQGNGNFTRITQGNPIVSSGGNSLDGEWGDYDNDGDLDLFVSNQGSQHDRLFRNEGGGAFTRISSGPHVNDGANTAGVAWADFDNDGYLDLFVVEINGPDFLYRNNGDGTFSRINSASLSVEPSDARTSFASLGDYDNDGFVDAFVAAGGLTGAGGSSDPRPNHLYRNAGNANHWIKLKLVGTVSNHSAIGAKVKVKVTIGGKTLWQMREISASGPQHDMRPNFGLGNATVAETIRIEWPSGIVQELHNVPAKQILTITEPPKLVAEGFSSGELRFRAIGAVGHRYRVETSTNLRDWTTWKALTLTTRSTPLTDELLNAPSRFYRIIQDQP